MPIYLNNILRPKANSDDIPFILPLDMNGTHGAGPFAFDVGPGKVIYVRDTAGGAGSSLEFTRFRDSQGRTGAANYTVAVGASAQTLIGPFPIDGYRDPATGFGELTLASGDVDYAIFDCQAAFGGSELGASTTEPSDSTKAADVAVGNGDDDTAMNPSLASPAVPNATDGFHFSRSGHSVVLMRRIGGAPTTGTVEITSAVRNAQGRTGTPTGTASGPQFIYCFGPYTKAGYAGTDGWVTVDTTDTFDIVDNHVFKLNFTPGS